MTDYSYLANTNSQILAETAQEMGIKVEILDTEIGQIKLTKNGKSHIVWKKSQGINNKEAISNTRNKRQVALLLQKYNIPTPEEIEITKLDQLNTISLPPFPLVVKPTQGEKGQYVFAGIKDIISLHTVVEKVLQTNPSLLIQQFIEGYTDRIFILNNQVIGIARRLPPQIKADGKMALKELIDHHNLSLEKHWQQVGKRTQNRLLNWPRLKWHLENQGLTLETIPPKNTIITPYPITNFQAGGTVETIPLEDYHPSIISLALKVAGLTKLTLLGIDIIVKDHTQSYENNVTILEVNSDPSLRLHEWPNKGIPQPVTKQLLNYIFDTN